MIKKLSHCSPTLSESKCINTFLILHNAAIRSVLDDTFVYVRKAYQELLLCRPHQGMGKRPMPNAWLCR